MTDGANDMSCKSLLPISILIFAGNALADDLTIPNTFQAGTPARAAEVNENFGAVEASVDDNAANIAANSANIATHDSSIATNASNIESNASSIAALTSGSGVMVYSQGIVIGRWLGRASDTAVQLVSPLGFLFNVEVGEGIGAANSYLGPSRVVYFEGSNCTGRAFINTNPTIEIVAGSVFASEGAPSTAYFTLRGSFSPESNVATASFAANTTCTNRLETFTTALEVFPNDEAVTGVPNQAPAGPLYIGAP